MRLVTALEQHFARTPDGAVWTQVAFAYPYWARFLQVFDHVRVVARVGEVASAHSDWQRADGAHVSFAGLRDYVGPLQYALHAREIAHTVQGTFQWGDAVLLRVPSAIGTTLTPLLYRAKYPYGLNVVGDPYLTFAPGVVEHPLRTLWQWWFVSQMKKQCANALAAAYVTEQYLQREYPCPAYTVSFSDVELQENGYMNAPRVFDSTPRPLRVLTVGSLAQLYKGIDVLIQAVAWCKREGLDVELVVVGDGKYRSMLEAQARALGLNALFRGQLTAGEPIRAQLDQADLFVLPSRVEGLPRAMIEAMARALPCIGSTVGGIPELLPPEDLVAPSDVVALAQKIRELANDPERLARMSARNLDKAREYRAEILYARRIAFQEYLREKTRAWLEARH